MSRIPEEMASFFNTRAAGYDTHMENTVSQFHEYYQQVARPIKPTDEPIKVLDLGCGTGLEIAAILRKAPRAQITCVDLSNKMLGILLDKYHDYREQLTVLQDSYLTIDYKPSAYDYVVSVMTMHHLLYFDKRELYKKIFTTLRDNGLYIEGDYVVSPAKEQKLLGDYWRIVSKNGLADSDLYHIDIPFSLPRQRCLLKEAGFTDLQVVWQQGEHYIYEVSKQP